VTRTAEQADPPRPRRDREATRRRILDAARDLFGTQGYDTVTLRMIGAAADANPALVNRYFGTKSTLPQAIAGDPAGLPRRLAEHVVRQVRSRPQSRFPRIVDRSIGDPEVQRVLSEYLAERVIEPLTAQLSGPDARARATLAAVLIMGGAPARRLIGLDALQDDPADLTRRLTAMFTAALF
jgi:AcrR family transcriptional regulator